MEFYDPLPIDSEPRKFVSERVLKAFDPFPLEKHKHLFREGQRVTVIDGPHAGRSGRLKAITTANGHVVQLDGGDHLVEYHYSELEPEGFSQSGERVSIDYSRDKGPMNPELSRALKSDGVYDPLPVGDALEKAAGSHRLRLGGRIKMKDGRTGRLTRFTNGPDGAPLNVRIMLDDSPETDPGIDVSLDEIEPDDDDTLSLDGVIYPVNNEPGFTATRGKDTGEARTKAWDPLPLDVAEPVRPNQPTEGFADGLLKAIKDGTISAADRNTVVSEIRALRKGGGYSRVLEALCEKYSNDRLEKRARPGLRVGMKVRDVFTGEVGIIKSIEGSLVKVERADGESHVLVNVTMETLIPVEAAA